MSILNPKTDLFISVLIVIILFLFALHTLPVMPIDETRYLSVAWEMWAKKSFLLPILNGQPYSHKPPLFFWLIHLGWLFFGVNSVVPRTIPFIFAILNLFLTYKISNCLFEEKKIKIGGQASLILSGTWFFLLWSFLIMFDMILSFWVLLGIFGIIKSIKTKKGWILVWLSLSLGGLTKGPVILLHILPVAIFSFWWSKEKIPNKWYILFVSVIIISFLTDLIWILSAVKKTGKFYEKQILFTQTIHRVVSSFAHKRPIWWYLTLLPILFFPWAYILHDGWNKEFISDKGSRLCIVWAVAPLILFSFISCKQIHYLLPELPAVAILFAFAMNKANSIKTYLLSGIFFILSIVFIILPKVKFISKIHTNLFWITIPIYLILLTIFFLKPVFKDKKNIIRSISISICLLFCLTSMVTKNFLKSFDLTEASRLIAMEIKRGLKPVYIGKYHGEFHFLGRITTPFKTYRNINKDLKEFLINHQDTFVITNFKQKKFKQNPKKTFIIYRQKIRGKILIVWKRDGFMREMLHMD